MKLSKSFRNRITSRYRVIIQYEDNFAHKSSFGFTYAKVIVLGAAAGLVFFLLSFQLSKVILLRWDADLTAEMRADREALRLANELDSLSEAIAERDQFIESIRTVVSPGGNTDGPPVALAAEVSTVNAADIDLTELSLVEETLREDFEASERERAEYAAATALDFSQLDLFVPVRGIVTADFNPDISHFGIDVVAKEDEPIKVVADGTVLLASWTEDTGHVIAVQHAGGLVSVYKHNASLLKKAGDYVKTGEAIAIIGNSGELTTGPHLHFEMWHNQNPLNPKAYLSF